MNKYGTETHRTYLDAWKEFSRQANLDGAKPPSLVFSRDEAEGLILPKIVDATKRYPIILDQNTAGQELALRDKEQGITYCQVFKPSEGQKFPVQVILGPVFLGNFKSPKSIKSYAFHELTHAIRYMTQPEIPVYSKIFAERTRGVLNTLRDVFDFSVEESIAWVASIAQTNDIDFVVRHLRQVMEQGGSTAKDIAIIAEQIDAIAPTIPELLTSSDFMERIGTSMKTHKDQRTRDMGNAYLGRLKELKGTRAWMDDVGMELYVL